MKECRLGVLGLGTVGSGVVNLLHKNSKFIAKKTGVMIKVVIVAFKNQNKQRHCITKELQCTTNPLDVINADVDIVIELIGDTTIAKELVTEAINQSKNVITANKALIATHGDELLSLAQQKGVKLLFEAAVAGGIPILKVLEQGLSANKINFVAGIINSTSNFVLSAMQSRDCSFDDALLEAKNLGYAEADSTFDVEGMDAGHKIAILSSMIYGTKFYYNKVLTQSIDKVKSIDIKIANELGFKIKQLAIAKKVGDNIQLTVKPTLLPNNNLLSSVDGVMNAVTVIGNAVGETMYYGAGAGSIATASSVVADVIDIINDTTANYNFGWQELVTADIVVEKYVVSEFYLRILVADDKGVLACISKILASFDIGIENMIQQPLGDNARIAIITTRVIYHNLLSAVTTLNQQNFIKEEIHFLNVETFNNNIQNDVQRINQ